ncbi:MAG: hypothetical protein K2X87_32030 [Gemmataceae bacterium]|nr:hypothetical protein [Gemmataceae bacterium]
MTTSATLTMPAVYPRYLVCRQVCEALAVPRQLFDLKLREGRFPASNVAGPGGERCYDQAGVEAVMAWWAGWAKYRRRKAASD